MSLEPNLGVKKDEGKLPYDYLDPVAIEALVGTLQFGAIKYDGWNWAKGLKYSRIIAALLRHLFAMLRGERIDSESGRPHADHVFCNAMFLCHMVNVRPDMDDLPKRKENGALDAN